MNCYKGWANIVVLKELIPQGSTVWKKGVAQRWFPLKAHGISVPETRPIDSSQHPEILEDTRLFLLTENLTLPTLDSHLILNMSMVCSQFWSKWSQQPGCTRCCRRSQKSNTLTHTSRIPASTADHSPSEFPGFWKSWNLKLLHAVVCPQFFTLPMLTNLS